MDDVIRFGALIGGVGIALTLAVLSNRVTDRIRVPAPAVFLIVAAIAVDIFPKLGGLSITNVQRIVTVALVFILFDGGMSLGWSRLRSNAGAVLWLGIVGTLVTAAATAALARYVFRFDWHTALLIGTALSPTDPAVVFSVLGRREVGGRSGILLGGESGANDPVGIALMAALLLAETDSGGHAVGVITREFAVQMGVGLAVGVVLGLGLGWLTKKVSLPSEGLYPIRTLAAALAIYGVATVAHGSGYLAVFVAGILIGDEPILFRNEVHRFHSAVASLGEIVAFVLLGLTVSVHTLGQGHAWEIGLALAVLLAVVVRPVLVGAVMLPIRLDRGERAFVLFAGLKGAVPILLGTYVLAAGTATALQVYDLIFIVVLFSVIVQGGMVPTLARWCRVPMRMVEVEPLIEPPPATA
jgi:potassium/hydrogen antiporter